MFRDRLTPFSWELPAGYLPFRIGGKTFGALRPDLAEELRRWPSVFEHRKDAISLQDTLETPEARTEALSPIVESLHEEGAIPTWVGELFPIVSDFGEPPVALVERAAVHFFGCRAFGVHVNGLVRQDGELFVWMAIRSRDNPLWPGKLDQLVAGGVAYGYSPEETVLKEAEEEAGISRELAERAVLVSKLSYLQPLPWGLEYGTLFVYDLWLPKSFVPQNLDGEVGGFQKISLVELAELLETSDAFKPNVALVYLDLLLRHGLIPTSHPEYPCLREKLYREVRLA